MAGKISGLYLTTGAVGIVLIWSGWNNTSIAATLKSLLGGKLPAPGTGGGAEPAAAGADLGLSGTETSPAVSSAAGSYNLTALQSLWTSSGGDASRAFEAANIALAESGGQRAVTSSNPDGGINVGLWQLDTKGVGAGHTVAELQNPVTNCQITIMATHNGTSWTEWADSVVVNGVYTGPQENELTQI